ncbi:uncharacterized protein [Lolium perenne]|uniref:uncharacterized protein isoform X1 n=1 Tax=Lolium perenne TaxID=4522 RepID=UPI0021F64A5B|nr:uncharacterized protein LOC127327115 isoform X2 [Lolium perenne]
MALSRARRAYVKPVVAVPLASPLSPCLLSTILGAISAKETLVPFLCLVLIHVAATLAYSPVCLHKSKLCHHISAAKPRNNVFGRTDGDVQNIKWDCGCVLLLGTQ